MHRAGLTQVLFLAAAVLFAVCAVLQFLALNILLGVLFAAIAAVGVVFFVLLRTKRLML